MGHQKKACGDCLGFSWSRDEILGTLILARILGMRRLRRVARLGFLSGVSLLLILGTCYGLIFYVTAERLLANPNKVGRSRENGTANAFFSSSCTRAKYRPRYSKQGR
jgi:hypothetical protein